MQKPPFVLVVDDERTISRLIVDVLAAQGYTAAAANTPEHALMIARARKPDLVLMDARLRSAAGVRVLDALRETGSFPAILMSGIDRDRLEAMAAGADCVAILPKPFGLDRLVSCVQRWTAPAARAAAQG